MKRRGFLVVAVGVLAAGCGYALQGHGITTDASVKKIGVPLFKDRTGQLGLDTRITAAVVSELLKRGRFTVVQDTKGVDAVVEGEIISYNVLPVNFSNVDPASTGAGPTQASRYGVTLVAKVVYRKIGQTEPIWANDAFSQRDEYDMGDQPRGEGYFSQESMSVDRLAESFAKSLVSAMLEAF